MADKVAIVTGGGSGIGAATAKRLARDGFRVVLNGRTREKLERVAGEIGDAATIQPGDVSKEDDIAALIEATVSVHGRIDVLVNAAGVAEFGPIDEVSLDAFDKVQAINVRGVYMAIRAALPHLEKSGGNVVTVSSVSGIGGDWGLAAYNTSKGAVSNMTRALALELGARGVRVNAVAPSLTDTDMAEGITSDEATMEAFRRRIPLGRAAQPEEIADVIAFLAGSDARFVTGVVLPVDGGVTASNGQPNFGAA